MGVNTFLSAEGSPTVIPGEVIRATEEEKQQQTKTIENLHQLYNDKTPHLIADLKKIAQEGDNIF